ncbi:hypothetical protein OVA26_01055 [Microbacterium sp. SL62]|uniref:hypothetical protein n=1 Tax=Microbacterium sp. SL62 TaxID=2995139 RepID=UPI0022745465|nr:hypothetical protein [Microbacterium sp. SL62]MCY1715529.1 hypothetical protein [Microbacterium sp. SL62]
MVDAADAALRFLRALKRLPTYTGIVFHGLPTGSGLSSARWTHGVTATSNDPHIATENFWTLAVAAIVSRTGRDIAAFSAHPAEQEILLSPEVVLLEVARTALPDGRPVVIVEQLAESDPSASLPPTLDELVSHVQQLLRASLESPPAPVTTPGEFVEPLFFLDDA